MYLLNADGSKIDNAHQGSDLLTKSVFGRYVNDVGHVMFSQQVDT